MQKSSICFFIQEHLDTFSFSPLLQIFINGVLFHDVVIVM